MAGVAVNGICGEDTDEHFDPRIKIELESLNQTASDVNRLEKEINEARSKYQETFYDCSQALESLRKKYGSKINKSRPYYETKELAKEAQSEAMLSARKYQSANGVYIAAKETISLAELRLKDDKAASLSPAWQEMLNHALLRVMESEQEKTHSEKEHLEKSAVFSKMEKKLHILEKKHKKAIAKSKPYFDAKNELELKLQQIKQSIEDLQQAMVSAKSQYSQSLKNLEEISDGIHEARRQKIILMYPREPGVGAEQETHSLHKELPTLPTSDLDLDSSSISDASKHNCSDSDDDDDDDDDDHDDGEASTLDELANDNRQFDSITNQQIDIAPRDVLPEQKNKNQINEESFIAAVSSAPESIVRIIGAKDKPIQLRKSISLPSYVEEDQIVTTNNMRTQGTFEIQTENVIVRVETGSFGPNTGDCIHNDH